MAENKLTLVIAARDVASHAVSNFNSKLRLLDRTSRGVSLGLAGIGGAAIGLAKSGLFVALGAVTAFGTALAGGVKGALDEQVGIERLNTALRNNVAGWNGNRTAIEQVIDARTRLAFDDSALRDSLSALVMRTHDVTKAMELQALAMDLARAKGIDLETASTIIGKVFSGNVGILTRYGIAIDKGATATEALAAIQKQTAGQAEAYGKTTKGAFEAFSVAMQNVFEDAGSALLPFLTDLASTMTTVLIPAVKSVVGAISQWFADNKELIGQLRDGIANVLDKYVVPAIRFMGEIIGNVVSVAAPLFRDVLIPAFQMLWGIVSKVVDVLSNLFDNVIKPAIGPALGILKTVLDGISTAFQGLLGFVRDLLGPIGALLDIISKVVGGLGDIIGLGPKASAAYRGPTGTILDDIIGLHSIPGRAMGGPVSGGRPYMVGENGPEMFVPDRSGSIAPNGGVTDVHTHIYLDGREIAQSVDRHLFGASRLYQPAAGTG